MFDCVALAVHGLNDGKEAHVKAQHLVFGMVGNPRDLVWVQTRIDGVQHAAAAADAKVQLKVAIPVPCQGSHAVAEPQLESIKRMGNLA